MVLWEVYARGEEFLSPGAARGLAELIRGHWNMARRAIADVLFPSGPIEAQRWLSNSLREHVSPETAARYIETYAIVDVRPYLSQVKAPTLVLHRRGDRNVPIAVGRAAALLIPDARFVALEGDIGNCYFGDTSYLETLTQFLDEGRVQEPASEPMEAGAFRTILFTDVEGSTALTQRLGDAKARELLREHERMVRESLKAHGGAEVKTMGDGLMVSFPSATQALECAIAMQRAFAEHSRSADEPIRVRVGLNAGEPVAEDHDLFGTAVQLARRIGDHAEPEQVLASDLVRGLAAGKGFSFSPQADIKLKGFEDSLQLYEVSWRE